MELLVDSDIIIDYLNNRNFAVELFSGNGKRGFALSVISFIEIVYGFKKNKAEKKFVLFRDFLKDFRVSILAIDESVSDEFLDIKIDLENKRFPLADFDLFIAATALCHNRTLVTRNIKHFKRIKSLKLFKF